MSISQIFLATHVFSVKFRHRSLYSQYSRPRKSPKPSKNSSELLFFHHILKNPVFHGRKFLICKLLYLLFPKPAQIFSSQGCLVPLPGMYILTKTASVPKRKSCLRVLHTRGTGSAAETLKIIQFSLVITFRLTYNLPIIDPSARSHRSHVFSCRWIRNPFHISHHLRSEERSPYDISTTG